MSTCSANTSSAGERHFGASTSLFVPDPIYRRLVDGRRRSRRTSWTTMDETDDVSPLSFQSCTQSDTDAGEGCRVEDGRRQRRRRHSYDGAETTTVAATADEYESDVGERLFCATRSKLRRTQSSSSTIAYDELQRVRRELIEEQRHRADRRRNGQFLATVMRQDQYHQRSRKNRMLTSTPNSKAQLRAERKRRKRRASNHGNSEDRSGELRQRRIADYCRATTRRRTPFFRDFDSTESDVKYVDELRKKARRSENFTTVTVPLPPSVNRRYGGENKSSTYHSHRRRLHPQQQKPKQLQLQDRQQQDEEWPHKTPIKFTTSAKRYDQRSTLRQKTLLMMYKNSRRKNGAEATPKPRLKADACGAPVLLNICPPSTEEEKLHVDDRHASNLVNNEFSCSYCHSLPSSKVSAGIPPPLSPLPSGMPPSLAASQQCSCCQVRLTVPWNYSDDPSASGPRQVDYCSELYRGSTTTGRDSGCMVEAEVGAEYDNLYVGERERITDANHIQSPLSVLNDINETNFMEISDKIYENLIAEPLVDVSNRSGGRSASSASSNSSSIASGSSDQTRIVRNDEPELYRQLVGAVMRDARKNCWPSQIDDSTSKAILEAQYYIEKFLYGSVQYDKSDGLGRLLLTADTRIFERDCSAICASVAEKLRSAKATSPRDYATEIRRVHALITRLRDVAAVASDRSTTASTVFPGGSIGPLQKFIGKIRSIF